jgi:hypothetical protein
VSLWITGAIGVVVALIGLTYLKYVRDGVSEMHRARALVIALAILSIAANELLVIPIWGVEAGTSVSSALFLCVILPLTAYLSTKRPR